MTTEDFKRALDDVPPGPFTLHLSEKSTVDVLHPDYAMPSPNGRLVTVWTRDERMHTIEVAAVIRLSHQQSAGVQT